MRSESVPRHRTPHRGFSLIGVLISLTVTLLVVALVFQTSRIVLRIYRTESRCVEWIAMASSLQREVVARCLAHGGRELASPRGQGLYYGVLSKPGSKFLDTDSNLE